MSLCSQTGADVRVSQTHERSRRIASSASSPVSKHVPLAICLSGERPSLVVYRTSVLGHRHAGDFARGSRSAGGSSARVQGFRPRYVHGAL
jgi:hypothetical protein